MHIHYKLPTAIVFCVSISCAHKDDPYLPGTKSQNTSIVKDGPVSSETKSLNSAIVISGVIRYPSDAETVKRLEAGGVKDGRGVAVYVVSVPKEVKSEVPDVPVVITCKSGRIDPAYACVQVRQQLLVAWDMGESHFVTVHTVSNTHLKLPNSALKDRTKYSATFYKPEEGVILNVLSYPATAYVTVVPNPFHAMTQSDGAFRFAGGLPPGNYTVRAFHPRLGSAVKEVRLDGETSGCKIEMELGTRRGAELPLDPYERFEDD